MKSFQLVTGLSLSLLTSSLAACSSDSKSGANGGDAGGTPDGASSAGGSGNPGDSGAGGKGAGGGGSGGKASGGGASSAGGAGNTGGGGNTDGGNNTDGGGNAGDSGAGDAGADPCVEYCADMMATCATTNGGFADAAACSTACAGYDTTGTAGASSGDTLQCRVTHLGFITGAAGFTADDHCPHAGATPTAFCQ